MCRGSYYVSKYISVSKYCNKIACSFLCLITRKHIPTLIFEGNITTNMLKKIKSNIDSNSDINSAF